MDLKEWYDFIKSEDSSRCGNDDTQPQRRTINGRSGNWIDIKFNNINKFMRFNLMNCNIIKCTKCLTSFISYDHSQLICCNQIIEMKHRDTSKSSKSKSMDNNNFINFSKFIKKYGNHYINKSSHLLFLNYELPQFEETCQAIMVINNSTFRIYNLYGLELMEAMEVDDKLKYELNQQHNKILIKKEKKRFNLILFNYKHYKLLNKLLNQIEPIRRSTKKITTKSSNSYFGLKILKKKFKKEFKSNASTPPTPTSTVTNYNLSSPFSIYKNTFLSTPNLIYPFYSNDILSIRSSISSSESSQSSIPSSPLNLNLYYQPNLDMDIDDLLFKFPIPPPRF
ncbi:hypothetical protein K502DRAFT_76058 [Neoconidiobolus thromboides FSU 785]|nr:hypothetical protein K502DRAFT_76058 [Neoconidiobolus thromboides FSU 785]